MTPLTQPRAAAAVDVPQQQPRRGITARQVREALPDALRKLDPRLMRRNPVMLIVWVGAALTTLVAISEPFTGGPAPSGGADVPWSFTGLIAAWLWFTVVFANLAESIAEGRGRAQAATLRRARSSTTAHRVTRYDADGDPGAERATTVDVSSAELQRGDVVLLAAGDTVPADGDIVHGIASIDESAITGESAPVIRESGGDRSAVTGGTRILSDRVVVRVTSNQGETFVDRMIALVEGANRQRTPNEIALGILLAALSIVFVVVVLTLGPVAAFVASPASVTVLVALLVCLIPTTIGALLSAIGIAGMDRLVQRNVLAVSGRAVEAAGDVTTLLLDKTGTITYGNRRAVDVVPIAGVSREALLRAAAASSLADPTPEGSSIVELAAVEGVSATAPEHAVAVPFTAQTRMSGLDAPDGSRIRKGAGSAVSAWIRAGAAADADAGASAPARPGAAALGSVESEGEDDALEELAAHVDRIASSGGTPLVVAIAEPGRAPRALGVVHLKDVVKEGMADRFAELRAMGIRTVMITGDNPLTAAAIAQEAGVDDFLAEATPEDKLALIRREQEGGRLVAMTGDGTNDAPALAQADVGVAMNSGTAAAKEAGNMVDLDSDPTKLIEIVRIGKQLLMTRGALTTFSIANDVAKYFAIVPAMFMGAFPGLAALNVMGLHSPASAVLSAVVFNALVIIALVPLSLRGVAYAPRPAAATLRRNLLVYGLGGLVAPFIGIWLIDLVVRLLPGF